MLRPMKPEEAALLAGWEEKTRPYPWSKGNFLEAFKSGSTFVLVWDGAIGPNGFVVLQKVADEAYIQNIMVDPGRQGKGLGTALVDLAVVWCRTNGVKNIKLDVDTQNFPALKVYEKAGFRVDGARPNAYPRGESGFVMTKEL
jgi:ribosomal protein S18 acetylase RimI-like enzyme